MDPLVRGSGHSFAYWKIGLTAMGVVVLTLLARLRYWGGRSGGPLCGSRRVCACSWVTSSFFYVTFP